MNNEPPTHIVIQNFFDLKHKINNKWPYCQCKIFVQWGVTGCQICRFMYFDHKVTAIIATTS